jgi:hypothetical protein
MRCVDVSLERLEPIALTHREDQRHLTLRKKRGLDHRERRRLCASAHIGPDDSVTLDCLVGRGFDSRFELLMRQQIRLINAISSNIKLPAMIRAANAAALVAAEKQRRAPVRTTVVHDSHTPLAVAKSNELLAKQHQSDRGSISSKLRRLRRGNPIFPHQVAHRGSRPDARQQLAFVCSAHRQVIVSSATLVQLRATLINARVIFSRLVERLVRPMIGGNRGPNVRRFNIGRVTDLRGLTAAGHSVDVRRLTSSQAAFGESVTRCDLLVFRQIEQRLTDMTTDLAQQLLPIFLMSVRLAARPRARQRVANGLQAATDTSLQRP